MLNLSLNFVVVDPTYCQRQRQRQRQSSGVTSLLEQCTSDIIQGPSVSQMDGFVSEIRSDVGRSRTDVRVEDLGPEES